MFEIEYIEMLGRINAADINWEYLVPYALFFLAALAVAVLSIYQIQVKEYLTYRWLSAVREKGFFRGIFGLELKLPAKTIRNALILAVASFCELTYFLFGLSMSSACGVFGLIAYSLLGIILAKVFVWLGVFASIPLARLSRRRTVARAQAIMAKSKAVFIGITGSYGKSSTKEFLYKILGSHFKVGMTKKNFNTPVGIALSVIQDMKPDTDFFIAEMGAYIKGEIEEMCQIVLPKYGILTSLGNQHIDMFGSKENLIEAKGELLRALPADGVGYVNADSEGYREALRRVWAPIVTFSLKSGAVSVSSMDVTPDGTKAVVTYKNVKFDIKTKLLGAHNISNLLPCIALAYDLGVPRAKIETTIQKLVPIDGKLSVHTGAGGMKILNDSYNSSVEGFIAALDVLDMMVFKKKLVVSKGVMELGREKLGSYKRIADNRPGLDLYTTDKDFLEVKGFGHVYFFKKESELLEEIKKYMEKDVILLVEGRFSPDSMRKLGLNCG